MSQRAGVTRDWQSRTLASLAQMSLAQGFIVFVKVSRLFSSSGETRSVLLRMITSEQSSELAQEGIENSTSMYVKVR